MIFLSLKNLQVTFLKNKFLNKYRIPLVNLQINNLKAAILLIHKEQNPIVYSLPTKVGGPFTHHPSGFSSFGEPPYFHGFNHHQYQLLLVPFQIFHFHPP